MKKNNQHMKQVVISYTIAFCRVEKLSKPKSLGSDLHFSELANILAVRILRSKNVKYILEDSYGNSTSIIIGEPRKEIKCTIKDLDLCYEESKMY